MIPPLVLLGLSSYTVHSIIQAVKEPYSIVLMGSGLQSVTIVTIMEAVTLERLSVNSWATVEP